MAVTDPNNRIDFNPAPETLQAIEGYMAGLEETLGGLGVDLGTEDTRTFARYSDGSVVYVKKALVISQTQPQMCSPWVNPVEFAHDVAGADYYDAMERRLIALTRLVHGAKLLCRKEGYEQAGETYDSTKKAADRNVPGARAAADDLGQQFEGYRAAASKRKRKASAGDDS